MGLPFRIVLYAPDAAAAEAGAEAAFARVAQLNQSLSDYEDSSELSRLSRTSGSGAAVPAGPDLWRVLERSQDLSRRSRGALDMTVGPYVRLWRRARMEHKLPAPERLAAASNAVGFAHVRLDPKTRSVTLDVPGMRLDAGAVAKGYATEEAVRVLKARGIRRALVTAGGDMSAGDPPPGRNGWRIEIAPLDIPDAPPARFALLKNQSLATSGDLFQRIEIGGVRYSHIVDPRTGLGLTDHSLVTVIARDGLTADGLSTAVSVLGPEAGLNLVESEPGAAVFIARKPGERLETRASSRLSRFLERD